MFPLIMVLLSSRIAPEAPTAHASLPVRESVNIPCSVHWVLPGIVLGPEPRLLAVQQKSPTRSLAGITSPWASPAPNLMIHLTGLLPGCDQVLVYLDDSRLAGAVAPSGDWSFPVTLQPSRTRGLLRVWVFRPGEGAYSLPPQPVP